MPSLHARLGAPRAFYSLIEALDTARAVRVVAAAARGGVRADVYGAQQRVDMFRHYYEMPCAFRCFIFRRARYFAVSCRALAMRAARGAQQRDVIRRAAAARITFMISSPADAAMRDADYSILLLYAAPRCRYFSLLMLLMPAISMPCRAYFIYFEFFCFIFLSLREILPDASFSAIVFYHSSEFFADARCQRARC